MAGSPASHFLPEHAKIERVGGRGREFWVDGANYPFETTRSLGPAFTTGAWRLEVSPDAPHLQDTFLHVLFVDDAGSAKIDPASAQLIQTTDAVGVHVGGWQITFPATPGAPASITAAH